MLDRLIKPARKPLLIAGIALVVAGGFALALIPDQSPVAKTVLPDKSSPSPSATGSATPGSTPEVAGSQTTAPTPAAATTTTTSGAVQAPAPARQPAAAPQAAPAPQVTLQIKGGGSTNTFTVNALPATNACALLTRARAAGKISSLSITYYAALQSDYVVEVNGLSNWVYKINGEKLQWGCTNPNNPWLQIGPGNTVTWESV
jgi:hypothetical protein